MMQRMGAALACAVLVLAQHGLRAISAQLQVQFRQAHLHQYRMQFSCSIIYMQFRLYILTAYNRGNG
jgi:hypothetical protein